MPLKNPPAPARCLVRLIKGAGGALIKREEKREKKRKNRMSVCGTDAAGLLKSPGALCEVGKRTGKKQLYFVSFMCSGATRGKGMQGAATAVS